MTQAAPQSVTAHIKRMVGPKETRRSRRHMCCCVLCVLLEPWIAYTHQYLAAQALLQSDEMAICESASSLFVLDASPCDSLDNHLGVL